MIIVIFSRTVFLFQSKLNNTDGVATIRITPITIISIDKIINTFIIFKLYHKFLGTLVGAIWAQSRTTFHLFFFFSSFNFLFSLKVNLGFFITLLSLNDFPLYLFDINLNNLPDVDHLYVFLLLSLN